MITFLLNEEQITIQDITPDTTVLDFLRENKGLCGTKEGCASGDCGACTIAIAQANKDFTELSYYAINSCVTFLSALDGKQVITVEHLNDKTQLHPVQQAMVEQHASQCGFCTPGFVMSLFCLYQQNSNTDRKDVEYALSGNLCRCTGYRPIIDAGLSSCQPHAPDKFADRQQKTLNELRRLEQAQNTGVDKLLIPRTREQLSELRKNQPNARLVAGSTDLALESTQLYRSLPRLISLSRIPELNVIDDNSHHLVIGAAVTFSQCKSKLEQHFPALSELLERFASLPIRNQATIGGNIANASPIGDMPPVLLALKADIVLDDGEHKTQISARDFFIGYRKTRMTSQQWIESIKLPKDQRSLLRAYKVSKRFEDDISAVCAVFNLALVDGKVQSLASGFGGVAATPVFCKKLEDAVIGLDWHSQATLNLGKEILEEAFNPIDDVRASAEYRNKILANLWKRFWLETHDGDQKIQTRVSYHA